MALLFISLLAILTWGQGLVFNAEGLVVQRVQIVETRGVSSACRCASLRVNLVQLAGHPVEGLRVKQDLVSI